MSAIARGGGGGRVHESVCISVLTRFRNNRSLFQIFLNAFRRGGKALVCNGEVSAGRVDRCLFPFHSLSL